MVMLKLMMHANACALCACVIIGWSNQSAGFQKTGWSSRRDGSSRSCHSTWTHRAKRTYLDTWADQGPAKLKKTLLRQDITGRRDQQEFPGLQGSRAQQGRNKLLASQIYRYQPRLGDLKVGIELYCFLSSNFGACYFLSTMVSMVDND